jgi:pre-mRNA-splicing helicase BRR2
MIYEGMDISDRSLVEELFSINAIYVVICTYKLCWDLTVNAFCVMILDTNRYDG